MIISFDRDTRELYILLSPGSFTHVNATELRSGYIRYVGSDMENITLDFQQVNHIESSGLGLLLMIRKAFRERVNIHLTNCDATVKKILKASNMEKKFKIS